MADKNPVIQASGLLTELTSSDTLAVAAFKLTTTPTSGDVLTSDSNGVGTWQANPAGGSQTRSFSFTKFNPTDETSPSAGTMTEYVSIYCARVDASGAGGVHGLADEDEDIRVLVLPVAAVLQTLKEGRIESGHTLIALQWLALNHADLRTRWTG